MFNPYDNMIDGVVTLSCASNRVGLCYFNSWFLELAIDVKDLDKLSLPMCKYIYYPGLDRVNYLRPSASNPKLLIPTRERAIVDYIKFEDEYGDEGILIESLQNYLRYYEKDLSELYKVAEFFKLPKNDLDYWLKEAREELDMSMG